MPSYLTLLHTNRGYQRFKMIELALTTYSVLFVDNQSLLCKWRFHNCTAYAIFILMIQSVYWIIDQYQVWCKVIFWKMPFHALLQHSFCWNIFLKPIYEDRLYIYEMGCVLCWFLLGCLYPAFNIWWLPIFGQGPCRPLEMCQHCMSLSLVHPNLVGFDKRLPFQMISNVRDSACSYSSAEPKPDWLLFDDTGTSEYLMPPFVLKVNCNLECINKVIRSSFDSLVISCDRFTHPCEQFLLTSGSHWLNKQHDRS